MATLTINLTSGPVTGSKSYTISDADVQSLLDWAAAAYANTLPVTPTNGQVMLAWVQSWIAGTRDAVKKFKQDAAAAAASAGVTGITVT